MMRIQAWGGNIALMMGKVPRVMRWMEWWWRSWMRWRRLGRKREPAGCQSAIVVMVFWMMWTVRWRWR